MACFCFSNSYTLRELLCLQALLIVSLFTTIADAASLDGVCATSHPNNDNKTTRRWFFGNDGRFGVRNSGFSSGYWEEFANGNDRHNSDDDVEGSIVQQHVLNNRLGLLHFGRIDLLSPSNRDNISTESLKKGRNHDKEEHPLRTNLWEMNLKWSFLSPNSKIKESTVRIELHPEGYCRITGKNSRKNLKEEDSLNSSILGVGRWKKRPWGVTMVIRPLFIPKSSLKSTNFVDDGDGGQEGEAYSKDNKDFAVVDERTEFIFHAKNFHWNGFGSNPKLTQGTILLQKQRNKNHNFNWWRSTTWSSSSILPLWPEELLGIDGEDEVLVSGSGGWGSGHSNFQGLLGILNANRYDRNSVSSQKRWFRPVVGTFIAKGILQKNNSEDYNSGN